MVAASAESLRVVRRDTQISMFVLVDVQMQFLCASPHCCLCHCYLYASTALRFLQDSYSAVMRILVFQNDSLYIHPASYAESHDRPEQNGTVYRIQDICTQYSFELRNKSTRNQYGEFRVSISNGCMAVPGSSSDLFHALVTYRVVREQPCGNY